jgi:predicted ATP-binding protein involved in virulence
LFNNQQYLESPVKWLQHIDYKESKNLPVSINLMKAKELLNEILDKNIEIDVSPDKVIFKERGTELTFEQLSDGYKTMISWIGDLLTRLSESQPNVVNISDFKGIVLIDEIDMFLHPKWEFSIIKKLRETFPNIQWFFTTHSPVLIMGASDDAVFYKLYKEEGETKISEPYYAKDMTNLLANGIISSPLFDLEDVSDIENDDYLYSQIHKQVKQVIQKRRKSNKPHISQNEITEMINQAIEKPQKA